MLPETGTKLRAAQRNVSAPELIDHIGRALRAELVTSRQATKTVMAWTGVSDRAARNWLNGSGGVSGVHLVQLASRSDAIWRLMIELAHREEAIVGFDIHAVEIALSRALGSIEALKRQAISRHKQGIC